MKKKSYIVIIILAFIAVLLFIIYLFLGVINKTLPKEIVYPPSGLSQSIFDSQNMKYTPNESLTVHHIYEHCPYQFDITDSDIAKVGEGGAVYKLSDTMYVYTTEYSEEQDTEEVLKKELSKAIMIDSDDTMTVIDNYVFDQGYINGFKADYYINCLTVSNGSRTASVYLTGYVLTITDEEYDHGYRLFLGIVTARKETESFTNAKLLLDTLMATYQYNDDVQGKLLKAEKEAAQQAEREADEQEEAEKKAAQQQKLDETIVSTDGSTTDMAAQGENTASDSIQVPDSSSNIPQQKDMTVTVDGEYTNVSLYFYYSNVNNMVEVTLYNPEKTKSYIPISNSNGTILFQLDKMEAGKWIVSVTGEYGTCSMKMYSDQTSQ